MAISSMRKYIKSSGSNIIIWLVVISMVGFGVFGTLYDVVFKKKSPIAVVTVNGLEVTPIEYRRAYLPIANTINELKRQFGDQAQNVLKMFGYSNQNLEQIVLEKIIQDKVVQSAADKLNIEVSKNFIEQKLQDHFFVARVLGDVIPEQLFVNNSLDSQMLNLYLERQGISESDFEEMIEQKFKQHFFQTLIQNSAYVSPEQIKDEYLSEFAKKKYSILQLNLDKYLAQAKKEQIADKKLEEFYGTNRENYRVPEVRKAQQWEFAPENYGITVKEPEILKYYNQHKQEFIEQPAKYTIKRIIFKIDNVDESMKIHAKARKLAQDLKSQSAEFDKKAEELQRSNLVTVKTTESKAGDLAPAIEKVIKNLTLDAIEVVKSDEGYEVVKLIKKEDATFKPLDTVKSEIKKIIELNRFNSQFASDAQRIINQAQDNSSIFNRFIESKNGKKHSIELKKGDQSPAAQKLFSLAESKPRGFYQQEGKGFLLELLEIKPSVIKPFKEVKEQVKNDYYLNQAKNALENDLKKGQSLIVQNPQKASKELKAELITTDWINPEQPKTQEKLRNLGIEIQPVLQLNSVGESIIQLTDKDGFIIKLDDIEQIKKEQIESKEAQIRQKLKAAEAQNIFNSLVESLVSTAKIDINKQMLNLASRV